ncbi:hypothetical protein Z957_12295 [Clostridium sp. K25]|uniref:HTH cro/C1-type domain-containing protein n=1 Tax=Clostridium novyi B str. ATCC 27606 TaxID=1443123 RepID=A0AA40IVB0_CLONO|nr:MULTISPECIES: helix-turn-helix transcriptional regulator [Clostridium]KEI10822.1 hypothetical protein Z957_12295 [Clostridium sp. K25]KEI17783.1 hypothetical protein Z959_05930 [Clostridium novyi B str. ATCC 27606]
MKINIEKLNWLRIEKGLSITKLAKKSKTSKATISRILRSKVKGRPDTIGKIAMALEVPVRELFIYE